MHLHPIMPATSEPFKQSLPSLVFGLFVSALVFTAQADTSSTNFPKLKLEVTGSQVATSLTPSDPTGTKFTIEATPTLEPLPYWTTVSPIPSAPTNDSLFYRVRYSDRVLAGQDSDGDGIDDFYEFRHPQFLSVDRPNDAAEDWDGDGQSNLAEYLAGTDPDDPGGKSVAYLSQGTTTSQSDYNAALKADGRLLVWQVPYLTSPLDAPRTEPLPGTKWRFLASSGETRLDRVWTEDELHTLAIAQDGSLWAWGSNNSGELGLGAPSSSTPPTQVGTDQDWSQVVAGRVEFLGSPLLPHFGGTSHFSIGIKTDGSLWQWGLLTTNDLSADGSPKWTSPHRMGTETNWSSIQLFRENSIIGTKKDGSLWIWGYGANSYFGPNFTGSAQLAEPREFGGTRDWARVIPEYRGSFSRILAIKRDGTLWSWSGFFAYVTTDLDLSKRPVEIGSGLRWRTAEYVFGGDSSLRIDAIREDGTLWSWGSLIGLATDHYVQQPLLVDSTSKWRSIHNGQARKMDGSLWRIGGVNFGDRPVLSAPWQIGTDHNWLQVSAGLGGSVAVRTDGSLWHWGTAHILPSSQFQTNYVSILPVPPRVNWTQVSLGRFVTSAAGMYGVIADGSAELWGYPLRYWGDGYVPINTIGGGTEHGGGGFIFVASQSPTPSWQPAAYETNSHWRSVLRGQDHGLGLKADGTLWSFGLFPRPPRGADYYQSLYWLALTNNVESRRLANTPVRLGGRGDWVSIAAGADHDAALTADGSLFTFGYNDYGQLGNGTQLPSTDPVQIAGAGEWAAVAAGDRHTLALKKDGSLWAWGTNDSGQLGLPTAPTSVLEPTQLATTTRYRAVYAGPACSFALDVDGHLWGWGENHHGQLGVGDTANHPTPTPAASRLTWRSLSAGDSHTLAIDSDGGLWGWGSCYLGAVPNESIVPPILYPLDSEKGW